MIEIQIKLFAILSEIAQTREFSVRLPDFSRIVDCKKAIIQQYPALAPYLRLVMIARNQEYAREDEPLKNKDEIALIPPVSGG
jgi:molybdopterin converting factor subunit 1